MKRYWRYKNNCLENIEIICKCWIIAGKSISLMVTYNLQTRLIGSIKMVYYTEKWKKFFFWHKKKFKWTNGCQYYWHDFAKNRSILKTLWRGFVMTWATFNANKKAPIVFIYDKIDSKRYVEIIETHILPKIGPGDLFKQDNVPIHVSKYSKKIFNDKISTFCTGHH